MDCKIVVSSISELIDGGLAKDEIRGVEEHLTSCDSCEAIRRDLDGVRSAAQTLPLQTPSPTLWVRIRAEAESELLTQSPKAATAPAPSSWWQRLSGSKVSFSLPQLAGGSIVAAALLISGGYFLRQPSLEKGSTQPDLVSVLAPDLEATLKSELSGFNMRKSNWDPRVRADFEHHLQQIDQSMEGCRVMLARNPSDREQQEMVRVLADEKIRLLKDSSRLKW